jgi:hypothetical protein
MTHKIPLETRQRILDSLVPLGERLFDHSHRLFEAGFTAWTVYYEDDIAGCSEAHIEFHRKFLVEVAKEEIGNGDLFCVMLWGAGTGYKSELLTRLRRERDAAGFNSDFFYQNRSEGWRCWLSPCLIERHRVRAQESERDNQLLEIRNTRLREEKAKEAARLAKAEWPPTSGETKARRFIARRLMDEALPDFNFRFREDLSIPGWIVFSRPLQEDWELRFGVVIGSSQLEAHLFGCKTSLRRELLVWPTLYHKDEYIEVLLHYSAVEFSPTYHNYRNNNDFEVCIRAVLFLYKLEHDFLVSTFCANI